MSDTFIIQLYSCVEILVRFARFGKRRARVAVSNSEGGGDNRSPTNTSNYQHRIEIWYQHLVVLHLSRITRLVCSTDVRFGAPRLLRHPWAAQWRGRLAPDADATRDRTAILQNWDRRGDGSEAKKEKNKKSFCYPTQQNKRPEWKPGTKRGGPSPPVFFVFAVKRRRAVKNLVCSRRGTKYRSGTVCERSQTKMSLPTVSSGGDNLPTKKFVELRMDDVVTTAGERGLIAGKAWT